MKKLISNGTSKACKYHWISRFIDDLCVLNDDNEFLRSFKNIHIKDLKLQVKRQERQASFVDFVIKIGLYFRIKLIDKTDKFPFFLVFFLEFPIFEAIYHHHISSMGLMFQNLFI